MDLNATDFASRTCCGLKKHYEIEDFVTIFNLINEIPGLTDRDKKIILTRFKRISSFININYTSVYRYYNASKIFIITAGIITPALMSINATDTGHPGFDSILFIFIWLLQLFISIISSYISFYKWDKKYFLYMAYKNKIEQEIWLYLELTARYGRGNTDQPITHLNKLNLFLNRIEFLYKKLKESNYEIEITDEEQKERVMKNHDFSPGIMHTFTPPLLNQDSVDTSVDTLDQWLRLIEEITMLRSLNDDSQRVSLEEKMKRFEILTDEVKKLYKTNVNNFTTHFNEKWKKYDNYLFSTKKLYSAMVREHLGMNEFSIVKDL